MFGSNLIEYFSSGIVIFILAALPITELRLALPLALTVYKLPLNIAYMTAVLGNIIPIVFLLTILPMFVIWTRGKLKTLDVFFSWWFGSVNKQYEQKIKRWGALALIIFVAIPLPMTGAWTGSVAAYLFKIPKVRAFIYITIGVMISGILVSLATLGVIKFL
jgi:uncharacterized membrane protein